MASPRTTVDYEPLDQAAQKWDLCVSFPHMKDAYWMAVDYGVVDEAKRQGVRMQLVEAGGYTNLNTQISQIEDCVARGADAVIIGAISLDGLNNLVTEIRNEGHPGDRRDQRHLLARAVGQVARFVRRDGLQGRRVPRQDASRGLRSGQGRLVPWPARRRLGRGRQSGLPGGGQGQRDRDRRHQVRRHRQGGAAQAGRGHARGLSRTSTTSSARR